MYRHNTVRSGATLSSLKKLLKTLRSTSSPNSTYLSPPSSPPLLSPSLLSTTVHG